ncbi:MAG: Hint domain-containing protein [Anaerolineales bacterium]|nr:Hint domain-containing protein [Anaerolineales bacterium]
MLVGFLAKNVETVYACNNWCDGSQCIERDIVSNACTQWVTLCCDTGGGSLRCHAGYYACNNPVTGANSCCLVGTVPPPNPWTCFAAGTKVKMEGNESKNIEEVVVGDRVVSQDEQGNRSVSTVTKLDQPIREHMCRVSFANSQELKMTTEHPVMTKEGWKSITPSATAEENPELIVASLQKGDEVLRDDGGYGRVADISCWSAKTPAYNLILGEGAHT